MGDNLKIAVVMSSTRDDRINDRVAKFVTSAIEKDHVVETLDPTAIDLPFNQQSINFMFNPGAVPQHIIDFNEKVKRYDAFVFVCAEYNWSLPPGLTNMMDNVPPFHVVWKPCGLVNYSISAVGGARASVQLRSFTGALGMIAVPKQMVIPLAHETISPDGKVKDDKLTEELNLLLQHVYWAARAFKSYREKTPPPPWAP